MTEHTPNQKALSEDLVNLGHTATAAWVLEGRMPIKRVLAGIKEKLERSEAWLSKHTYEPDTVGQETHERVSTWCEKAKFLLDHWEGKA